jgi:hypothetical protein
MRHPRAERIYEFAGLNSVRFPRANTARPVLVRPVCVNRLTFVGKARIASDHEEPAKPCQSRSNIFGDAVGEIFLLFFAARVRKRQNRNRRPARAFCRGLVLRSPFDLLLTRKSNETISNSWNCNDPIAATRIRAQLLPERCDLNPQIAFIDSRVRPMRPHQFGFSGKPGRVKQPMRPATAGLCCSQQRNDPL